MGMNVEERLREIKEHFGELIDDDTARLLAEYSLGKFVPDTRKGRVKGPVKDKRIYRDRGYCRLVVETEDGDVNVYFWDEAYEVALNDIFPGMDVEVEASRGESGYHVRSAELVRVEVDESRIKTVSEIENGTVNVRGRIAGIEGIRKTRDGKKLASFVITDGKEFTPLILWDDKVEFAEILSPGDEVIIFNAYVNEFRGKKNIHAGRNSYIDVRRFS
ncbi:OB-fold nucleic acid binding domain-containing protein [Geoglobus acetivorans]